MPYLNYVRERLLADVHVLGTTQSNGSGGVEGTLIFTGQNAFTGMNDTLTYHTHPGQSEQTTRDIKLRTLQLGLMRYLARTPLKDRFAISYMAPANPDAVIDKWHNWVFSVNTYGYYDERQGFSNLSLGASASASKVTEDWKIELDGSAYYGESHYTVGGVDVVGISRSQYGSAQAVRSISDHWSIGLFSSATSSVYSNMRLGLLVAPAIEFNVFPYSKSTSRQFRFVYRPALAMHQYNDTTIFNKMRETLGSQALGAGFKMTQNWGSISCSAYGSSYLHDFSKNALDLYASVSLQVVKGLSVSLGGGYSFVRDQLSLPKAGATDEQILLQLTQIATTYTVYGNFTLSYTFGSIYNTVVNPRFSAIGGLAII
jgi:hypothetical protein